MGIWYVFTFIPRWIIDFPENWPKWRNISSTKEENLEEKKENGEVTVRNPQINFIRFHMEQD